MIIIPDTNILFSKWNLKNPGIAALFDFAKKTKSEILIPEIVWSEIRKNYKEKYIKQRADYAEAAKSFSSFLIEKTNFIINKEDPEQETEKYMTWLGEILSTINGETIIPFNDTTLRRVVKRATYKIPPFNKDNQKEFKDALVWESVIDVLSNKAKYSGSEVCFISNDNCFSQDTKDSSLHKTLREEADALTIGPDVQPLLFYKTVEQFLSAHNTPVLEITADKINDFLKSPEGIARVVSEYTHGLKQTVASAGSRELHTFRPVNNEFRSLNLIKLSPNDSFYTSALPDKGGYNVICEREAKVPFEYLSPESYRVGHAIMKEGSITLQLQLSMIYADDKFKDLKGSFTPGAPLPISFQSEQ